MSKENIPRAIVAPEMFRWARERANLPQKAIDDAIQWPPGCCAMLEDGQYQTTVVVAQKIAEVCGVNFACLFLPEPPAEPGPLELQEALETVLEWAIEGIHAEEQMRGGRESFVRRHGNRDYEALEMVRNHVEGRRL